MSEILSDLLRESKLHGSSDYPIEHYICQIPYTYHFLSAHWHEEFEITLVTSGTLSYTIGNENHIVTAGSMLFVAPNTLHSASQVADLQAETFTVVFHLNLLGLGSPDYCTSQYIEPIQTGVLSLLPVLTPNHPGYAEIRSCFGELWECQSRGNGFELLVKSILYRLIFLLCSNSLSASLKPPAADTLRNSEKIKPVLAYIRDHYADPLTIEELASISGFSPVHFMNIFKKVVGSSCIDYIISYRISMSTIALKETDHPILKIAMDNGFQNISYYNRTFRRKLGMTPSEYRKRL